MSCPYPVMCPYLLMCSYCYVSILCHVHIPLLLFHYIILNHHFCLRHIVSLLFNSHLPFSLFQCLLSLLHVSLPLFLSFTFFPSFPQACHVVPTLCFLLILFNIFILMFISCLWFPYSFSPFHFLISSYSFSTFPLSSVFIHIHFSSV
jgi:hypothetical protein